MPDYSRAMSRSWLLAISLSLVLAPAGCTKDKADQEDEDEAEKKKSKKKKKKKKADDAKPKVYVNCSDAKSLGSLGYLNSSKTSEAKNTVGAISRGATAAYERERATDDLDDAPSHELCKSASPVPADGPPKGKKYQPNTADGQDFESGDAETGWRCLKFSLTQPHHYQYGYNAGSGYKSTEYGLPDPGPNGFEAWAMGDLDGDGKPSLFVRTGVVNPETQRLKLSTTLSCVDPAE